MSKQLESLKDILVPQANPDAGEDLDDGGKEERNAYRTMKKIKIVRSLPGEEGFDGKLKDYATKCLSDDLRYLDAAIDLLSADTAQSRILGVQLAKKSKDPYVQAFILARLIKDQAEVKAAEEVIGEKTKEMATKLNKQIYG